MFASSKYAIQLSIPYVKCKMVCDAVFGIVTILSINKMTWKLGPAARVFRGVWGGGGAYLSNNNNPFKKYKYK